MMRSIFFPAFVLMASLATAQNWNISLTPVDETCANANDGYIDLRLTGSGISGFTFTWQVFASDDDDTPFATGPVSSPFGSNLIDGLGPDEWTVVVTRSGTPAQVRESTAQVAGSEDPLVVTKTVLQNNACNSGFGGIVQAQATGGSETYEYGLGSGAGSTSPNYFGFSDNGGLFEGLPRGTYRVWVRDERGCIRGNTSGDFEITEPAAISIQYDTLNATCNDTGGQIIITNIEGGVPFETAQSGAFNYEIEWFDELGEQITSFDNSGTLTGRAAGTYSVVITDKFGCTGSAQFEIFQGFNLAVNSIQNVTCATDKNAFIQVRLDTDSENDAEPFELRIYDSLNNEITAMRQVDAVVGFVDFDSLGPNRYTIRATSVTGCEREVEVTITEPDAPALDQTPELVHVICKGEATGQVTLSAAGGSGTVLYSIQGDADAPGFDYSSATVRSGLLAGTYHIWLTDDSGCDIYQSTFTITEPPTRYGLDRIDVVDVTCFGDDNGEATLFYDATTDNTHPITSIIWRNAQGEEIASGVTTVTDLDEGAYSVEVNDTYGCQRSLTFQINEFDAVTINAVAPAISCPPSQGGGTATINASASTGGDGNLTYRWYQGATLRPETTSTLDVTQDGEYKLEVTDGNGCMASSSFTVEIPEEIAVTVSQSNVTCRGGADGAISVEATGGTPISSGSSAYGYSWEHEGEVIAITRNISGLEAGIYELSVVDDNGCSPAVTVVEITEPATAYSISGVAKDVVCRGDNNGEIDITITREAGHPTIPEVRWTKNGDPFKTGVLDLRDGDLEPATYVITTVDEYGCQQSASFEISDNPQLFVNPTVRRNRCFGDTSGEIEVNPVGGYLGTNPNYQIRWFRNGVAQPALNDQMVYSGLGDGIYRMVVTDSVGCVKDTTITLQAPALIGATATVNDIQCKGDNNGSIEIVVTGGTAPHTVLWQRNDANGEALGAGTSITDLAPGNYFLTIEDVNNCQPFTTTYTITEPATEFDISLSATAIACAGENNGQLAVLINEETGHPNDYTVRWFKNGQSLGGDQNNVTEAAILPIQNLDSAEYTVTVTDINGCERTASYTHDDPSPIFFNLARLDSATCNGYNDGRIVINPSGGYGNFVVQWESETNGVLADQDFDLNNISGGRYTIRLTDRLDGVNKCTRDTVVFVRNPQPIVVTPQLTIPRCTGGSDGAISITVVNGTAPYSFQWFLGGELISTNQNLTNLSAGTYELVVTDQFQCQYTNTNVVLNDPPSEFVISGVVDPITCRDALDGKITVDVQVTGDPITYTVAWLKDGQPFSQNTEDLDGVGAGTYELSVTDNFGCTKTEEFVIVNPDALTLTTEVKNAACYLSADGGVSVQVSGGYGGYQYAWKRDNTPLATTASFINNVTAGFYTVTVTDGQGCVLERILEVAQPDPFLIELTNIENNTCATPFDASIDATVTGGTAPYSLQWFRDDLPFSKEEDLTALRAGTYYLVATDTNFCTTTSASVVITSPERLNVQILAQEDNLCPNTENGSLSIQGTGGSLPYTYSFDSSAFDTRTNYLNLAGGQYTLTVRDDVGCTFDTTLTVNNQYQLEPDFTLQASEFAIDFPITLTDRSLGQAIVGHFWDFGDTRASTSPNTEVIYKSEGTYVITLKVTNEVGCELSKSDTVQIERGYNFAVPTAFSPNDDRTNDTFRAVTQNVEELHMVVQDRNGHLMYETRNLEDSWDGTYRGTPAPQGSYYFEITFTAKSGVTRVERGKVFLLR